MSNATCFSKHAPLKEPPLIQNGQLKFQAHQVGWIIATFFTLVACIVSLWLTIKHLTWYTNERQQRYIVRLLFMVPIYASVSLASYIFWNHAIPITLARDSYEAFVLYCFFYLLLQYLSPTAEGQKDVFRRVTLERWIFPFGFVKYRPEDGLYFLQLMKWGMLQYCVVRPTTTLAAVILDSVGLYCDSSWSPGWGHVYILVIVSTSVTVAMYCLIQLYVPVATQLAPYKPLLKLFSVKAVVFLTFWQATGLSLLATFGVVKDTNYMTANDINTGIAALLETFEMMCFAFLHIYAFSYAPYREGKRLSDRTPRLRSLMHVLDLRDLWREFRDGTVYMGKTMRGVEVDEEARRRIHFAEVMGRERELLEPKCDWTAGEVGENNMLLDSPMLKTGHDKVRMWLSDPSARFGGAFQDEVERELRKRELEKEYLDGFDFNPEGRRQGHRREQGSWWRSVYDRLFRSGSDQASEDRLSPVPQRPSRVRRSRKHYRDDSHFPSLDSPPPPADVMFEYGAGGQGRSSVRLAHSHKRTNETRESQTGDDAYYYEHRHKPSTTGLPRRSHTDHPSAEFQELPRMIFAPRPVSTSQTSDIEALALEDEKPLPTIPLSTVEHGSNRLVSSSDMFRSDSVLARVFSSSMTNTVDGHVSSENKTIPASSQDTHSTGSIFPQAVSSLPIDLVPSMRDTRGDPYTMLIVSHPDDLRSTAHVQTLPSLPTSVSASREARSQPTISPRHSRPRPDIILPTPLSPARHPVVSTRHGNSPPQYTPPTRLPLMQNDDDDHALHRPQHSNMIRNSLRNSVQIERPLAKQQRATKMKSAPMGYVNTPVNTQFAKGFRKQSTVHRSPLDILQERDSETFIDGRCASEHPQLSDSPIRSGSAPFLTTTPSASPARSLRHAGDDISKARRPWS